MSTTITAAAAARANKSLDFLHKIIQIRRTLRVRRVRIMPYQTLKIARWKYGLCPRGGSYILIKPQLDTDYFIGLANFVLSRGQIFYSQTVYSCL